MFILDKVKLRVCILGETWHLSAKICNYVIATLECPKTRKSPKPDPARIFRVFWGVTWETWNFIKLNPARPRPEFSGSGFFPGFRVHHVGHPTNTHRKVWKKFAKLTFAAAFIPKLHQHCCCYSAGHMSYCCFSKKQFRAWVFGLCAPCTLQPAASATLSMR